MMLAKDIYLAHVAYMKEGYNVDIPEWETLTEDAKLYWHLLATAALANVGTPSEAMIDAAVKEMKKPRMVEETRMEDAFKNNFLRFYKAAIVVKIKTEILDVPELA